MGVGVPWGFPWFPGGFGAAPGVVGIGAAPPTCGTALVLLTLPRFTRLSLCFER